MHYDKTSQPSRVLHAHLFNKNGFFSHFFSFSSHFSHLCLCNEDVFQITKMTRIDNSKNVVETRKNNNIMIKCYYILNKYIFEIC